MASHGPCQTCSARNAVQLRPEAVELHSPVLYTVMMLQPTRHVCVHRQRVAPGTVLAELWTFALHRHHEFYQERASCDLVLYLRELSLTRAAVHSSTYRSAARKGDECLRVLL